LSIAGYFTVSICLKIPNILYFPSSLLWMECVALNVLKTIFNLVFLII
jgi:hypothetical protein